jgi:hypothetical protein
MSRWRWRRKKFTYKSIIRYTIHILSIVKEIYICGYYLCRLFLLTMRYDSIRNLCIYIEFNLIGKVWCVRSQETVDIIFLLTRLNNVNCLMFFLQDLHRTHKLFSSTLWGEINRKNAEMLDLALIDIWWQHWILKLLQKKQQCDTFKLS